MEKNFKKIFKKYLGLTFILIWGGGYVTGMSSLQLAVVEKDYNTVKQILEGELKNQNLLINEKDLLRVYSYKNFISYRSKAEVKTLLEDVFENSDILSLNQWAPLNWAVFNNDLPMVKLLLDFNADPNSYDSINATPLNWAALWASPDIIKELINRGAKINIRDDEGYTPLLRAIQREPSMRDINLIKDLIRRGARLSRKDKRGRNSFLIAAASCNNEALKYLYSLNPSLLKNKDYEGNNALHWATAAKSAPSNIEVIKNLFILGVRPDEWNNEGLAPFHIAVYRRNIPVVEFYLKNFIDPNLLTRNRDTSLHIAAQWGYDDIIRVFLKTLPQGKANLQIKNAKGYTIFNYALYNNHIDAAKEITRFLNLNPLEYDSLGETGLHLAARSRNLDLMTLLFNRIKFIPDKKIFLSENKNKQTILEVAVWNGDVDMVIFLIKKGALGNILKDKIESRTLNRLLANARTVEMQRLILKLKKNPKEFPRN